MMTDTLMVRSGPPTSSFDRSLDLREILAWEDFMRRKKISLCRGKVERRLKTSEDEDASGVSVLSRKRQKTQRFPIWLCVPQIVVEFRSWSVETKITDVFIERAERQKLNVSYTVQNLTSWIEW
jgi:hypothetical protein